MKNMLLNGCETYSDFVFDKGYNLIIENDNNWDEEEFMEEKSSEDDSYIVKSLY